MNRRYSRAHQILKNAGVINSTDEESDNSDIIENTPNASPMHCNEEKAKPTHLEVHYPSSIQACGVNEKCTAVSSYIHDKETEVGEISIEAPAYSPLTPRPVYGVGERSVEVSDIISPLPFVICPTVVKTSAILVNSPSSSPVPDMSPATSKVFHMLIGAEQDSDDSVADPNYEVEYNDIPCDDSSDDQNEYRNKHVEQNHDGSESPSILTEVLDNVERQDGPDFLALQNIEDQENLKEIPKKRKVRNPSTWKTNIEKHRRLKATLNISGGFVKGALNKINSEGILTPDCRGKKVPPNKLSSEDETFIRDHILSYPAVESHYCRQNIWLQYRKEDPDKIFIKDTYDKNIPFQEIHLKKKRGKTVVYPVSAYSQRLKISSQKKNDLIKLCQDGQIPRIYHPFYENLPSSETVKDCLPEPDVTEDSE
ncbi:hypothetical protein HW555_009714 [Spodoptera exigua]|uniref:Uncharacterized protein n=1 Tax=Spodoptera exigua TaxID=7107 RepID=A0A835GC00_SPOEX|nr:hypothetical protein HW555_009714 [Spodoptera exigua]